MTALSGVSDSNYSQSLALPRKVEIVSTKKFNDTDKVIESIKKVNLSVNWNHYNRFIESDLTDINKKTFLIAADREIFGYSTLKKESSEEFYINMLAVTKEHQTNGFGITLLIGTLEKAKKMGCKLISLEFRDNQKLNNYYTNAKIPYEKDLKKAVGEFKDGEVKNKITYILSKPE